MIQMAPEIDVQCSVCRKDGVGTYRTLFRCSNCGLEGVMIHSLGHEKKPGWRDERCPRCNCDTAKAGDYLDQPRVNRVTS